MVKPQPYPAKQFFKDFWMFLEGYRPKFIYFTILRALATLSSFLLMYIVALLVDFLTTYQLGTSLQPFYFYVALIAALGAFRYWFQWYAKMGLRIIGANIRKDIRVKAMSKLIDLELQWHEKEETGSKLQKIDTGSEHIYRGLTFFSNQGITIPTQILGALLIFITLDWRYALFATIFAAIYLFAEYKLSQRVAYYQKRQNLISEKVAGKIHESTSNLLTVKSLGLKKVFTQSTSRLERAYFKTWYDTQQANRTKIQSVKIFASVASALFLLLIGFDTIHGTITIGLFVAFRSYFHQLSAAVQDVTNNSWQYIQIKSRINRFMTIFGQEIYDRNSEDHKEIPKDWKTIEFRNIYFSYKNKPVLENFNLIIQRKKKVGIVGRTGCGKSTLVKLLLGLYQPQRGQILIDNTPLNQFKHTSITETISIVLQESEMFNSSLLQNVTIATPRKNLEQFKKAVKISQLEPVIKKLPQGLNTLIGEKGYKLSGGERQRIGLARVIYKNSPVMLLDEATSSLDSKTEHKIQEAIDKHLKDNTLIIIAHRLSTLKNVNEIIVMSKGKTVEQGTYKQLINKHGKFYELYKHQKKK